MSKMVPIDAVTVKLLHRPNYLIAAGNSSKRKAGRSGNAVQALPRLVRPLKKTVPCLERNDNTFQVPSNTGSKWTVKKLNRVIHNKEKELIIKAPEQCNVRTQSKSVCVHTETATETAAHYTGVSQVIFMRI
jgi:hypothetical protein